MNDAKEGSKPEPKELEHGPKLIADRTLGGARMLLISKPDRIVTRDTHLGTALSTLVKLFDYS